MCQSWWENWVNITLKLSEWTTSITYKVRRVLRVQVMFANNEKHVWSSTFHPASSPSYIICSDVTTWVVGSFECNTCLCAFLLRGATIFRNCVSAELNNNLREDLRRKQIRFKRLAIYYSLVCTQIYKLIISLVLCPINVIKK